MSSDRVEEEIELHLIDTKQLVEEARKIREAKDLARQAKQVTKELASGVSPLGLTTSPGGSLPKGFFTGEQTRRGAISGGRTDSEFAKMQKKIKELESTQKQDKIEQQQALQKVFGSLSTIATNPTGYFTAILTSKLGKFGVIGSIIAVALGEVLDIIDKQLKRGGALSTALKVTEQALTINDIEELSKYRGATKYITHDLRVAQRAPNDSNTSRLTFEHIRFLMDERGI